MARRPPFQRRRTDPTITLINVVFLMLMFFLVAGTIAAPPPSDLRLVQLAQADPSVPPDVIVLAADGIATWRGAPANPAAYVAVLPPDALAIARIMPDRDAPAQDLIQLARTLRAAGAAEVRIVTERSTE